MKMPEDEPFDCRWVRKQRALQMASRAGAATLIPSWPRGVNCAAGRILSDRFLQRNDTEHTLQWALMPNLM